MVERDILDTGCKLSYNLAKIILTLLVAALLAQLARNKARINTDMYGISMINGIKKLVQIGLGNALRDQIK